MKNIPKLRFPEFRDAGEWEEKPLGKCLLKHPDYGVNAAAVPFSENLPKYLRITDISEDGYYLSNGRVSVNIEATSDNYLDEGDIVLARTGASVGKSYKYRKEDGALVFAGFLIRVKPDKTKINSDLLFNFFSTEKYWKWVGVTSARSGQPGINGNEYASLAIPIPPTLKEQQKIADCLSSIDELITSQVAKVKALKEHKKALMQRLFPREGETVPRLRFPEFQNAPEWEEKPLGAICDYWNGGSHESGVSDDGEYFLISLNSLDIEGNLKADMKKVDYLDGSLEKDDLVMVLSDVAHGNFLGLTAIIPNSNYVLNQRMAGLRRKSNEKIVIEFLRLYINHNQKYFKQHGQGSSQLNLSKSSVTDFPVLLPLSEKEQQKIADCLSFIDELITSQAAKVEALKEHKKALMQQLFPSAKKEMC